MPITEQKIMLILKKHIKGKSQRQAAADLGITPQYLNDILMGRRSITGEEILRGLGLKKIVTFREDK